MKMKEEVMSMKEEMMKEESVKEEHRRTPTPSNKLVVTWASFQLSLIAYYTSTPTNTPGYIVFVFVFETVFVFGHKFAFVARTLLLLAVSARRSAVTPNWAINPPTGFWDQGCTANF